MGIIRKCCIGIAIIIGVFLLFILVTFVVNVFARISTMKVAKSFDKVEYEKQLVPTKDEEGYLTFITDDNFKILQLTDVHLSGSIMTKKFDKMAMNAVASIITQEKPDFVIVTGDVAFAAPLPSNFFNFDNKSVHNIFANLMEELGVYWTIAFGNHDSDWFNIYNREAITKFYKQDKFKYCLFEGDQFVNIKNSKGEITQTLAILDSHASKKGVYENIKDSQIDWYVQNINNLNQNNVKVLKQLRTNLEALYSSVDLDNIMTVKSLAFFHIPFSEYKSAWQEYEEAGMKDTKNVRYYYGVLNEKAPYVFCPEKEDQVFETMLKLGSTQGVFVGHDHLNNFSLDYKGIRLSYAMSIDYYAYKNIGNYGAYRGGTIINIAPNGTFDVHNESYYQDKYITKYPKEDLNMGRYME